MHEYGMCDGIVDAVQRRAAGRRVARVKIRIGVMHRIVEEVFQQAFAHAAAGSAAENATVDIVAVPVRVRCRACEAKFEVLDFATVCRNCNGVNLEVIGGDELILESLQYDAARDEDRQGEAACASESPDKS